MSLDLPRPDAAAPTQIALLDVAEQLFARHGIAAVSLRRIVLESGQGNLSAAHYHFGSRDALIRAVLERRQRQIDAVRHRRLDRLVALGRERELEAVVGAAVESLADVVAGEPWGPDYVRVIAQGMLDRHMGLPDSLAPDVRSGLDRARSMARALLPGISRGEFDLRVRLAYTGVTHELARWVEEHGTVVPSNRRAYRSLVRTLVAFMTAGLGAQWCPGRRARAPRGAAPDST